MKYIIARNICTIFGLGNISKMPGTLGSIVGIIFGLPLLYFFSTTVFIGILVVLTLIAFYSIYIYQQQVGKNDKSEIIIDELIGQLLVLPFINFNYIEIILAFLLFRFFDIFKIYPCNIIDKKYSNQYGVVFDDIIAAIQAILILKLLIVIYDKL